MGPRHFLPCVIEEGDERIKWSLQRVLLERLAILLCANSLFGGVIGLRHLALCVSEEGDEKIKRGPQRVLPERFAILLCTKSLFGALIGPRQLPQIGREGRSRGDPYH